MRESYVAVKVPVSISAKWYKKFCDVFSINNHRRNFHITLAYCTNASAEEYEEMNKAVREIVESCNEITLVTQGIDVFPAHNTNNYVIYLKTACIDDSFDILKDKVRECVGSIAYKMEEFRMHITLLKKDRDSISIDELKKKLNEISVPLFDLELTEVYHTYARSQRLPESWRLKTRD